MIVPIIVTLAILRAVIVGLIVMINSASISLSRTMQDSGAYIEDAASLPAGSSLLSETCTNFVLMPLNGGGDVNVNPLVAYAKQYTQGLEEKGFPIALILFDINYLKHTNDTCGHAAGDELLRRAAGCIGDCFCGGGENKCFRFGGDEFAAVIRAASPELMDRMEIRFLDEQSKRDLSIAWGCAFAEKRGQASIDALSELADKLMYERKKGMHLNAAGGEQSSS